MHVAIFFFGMAFFHWLRVWRGRQTWEAAFLNALYSTGIYFLVLQLFDLWRGLCFWY